SGVTAIGADTFHGSHKIVKATVADTVAKIGASAFEGCSSLGDLDFVQYADEIGAQAFKGCSGATGAATVKDGVASIPAEAFRSCSSLQTLTLPASMKNIGADAFNGCSALANVTLPGSLTLDSGAFSWCTGVSNVTFLGTGDMSDFTESYTWTPWYSGCYYGDHDVTVEIASGVTAIGADTFHGSHKIVKATVADTVTKIGASAFEGCSSLGDLDFVQYADEIGEKAFKGCSGAKGAVTVKDGVASIPVEAFRSCSSLDTLTLPASMKKVGADAFNGCSALANVTLPGSMTLESGAFSWCTGVSNVTFLGTGDMYDFTESYSWTPWYSGCYYGNHDVTVTLQSGVTSIGADTFHGSHKIVKATVADTVAKIGASAFEGCSGLGDLDFVRYADTIGAKAFKGCGGAKGNVTVKDGVGEIAVEAFRGCSSLQTLTLPASVKTIHTDAFNGCSALEDVTFPADAVMESGAFSWCTGVSHVTFIGTGDMSDFTDSYSWSPWYSGCYYGNHDLTIDIAPGVKSIGKSTFRSCGSVQSITVPLSVTHIDYAALHDCSTLHVYYAGTESQWGSVTKATTTGASGNTKLYMHYSSAPTLAVTTSDGRDVISRTFSAPENAIVFIVGYDSAGQMTETQSKTGGALTFTVSNKRTAKVRVLTFGANYAPLSAPIEAVI
ncbi:MAG: leucine-rich repeat domain-containing protein, partial [Oscillospiraceae bacterium]|nr:leucine-rich repeat domain-containing protein [Oscillospiraceae bacterium]